MKTYKPSLKDTIDGAVPSTWYDPQRPRALPVVVAVEDRPAVIVGEVVGWHAARARRREMVLRVLDRLRWTSSSEVEAAIPGGGDHGWASRMLANLEEEGRVERRRSITLHPAQWRLGGAA